MAILDKENPTMEGFRGNGRNGYRGVKSFHFHGVVNASPTLISVQREVIGEVLRQHLTAFVHQDDFLNDAYELLGQIQQALSKKKRITIRNADR
jgi:hypothetical protein